MKKTVLFLCCMTLVLSMLLSACADSGVTENTSEAIESETKENFDSTETIREPRDNRTLTADELGFKAYLAETDGYYIADAAVQENGDVVVTSYNAGEAVITVKNTYGEPVELKVKVGADGKLEGVDFEKFHMPEKYVYATDFGLDTRRQDNAGCIQAAIDSLENGGVVYIPAGNYKSSFIQLKNNITLRLEGVLPEYNTAFSDEITEEIESADKFAVLTATGGDMFANHSKGDWGRNGEDNITVTGGIIDLSGKARCLVLCCADGVLLENIVFKDANTSHVIQLTGSKNVVIRNVMFAGYTYSESNIKELVQIEPTAVGSIGGTSNSQFEERELYYCENILFENCYFGKSDEKEAPVYAIGHHGHWAKPSVTGLKILNCTFDNPRIAAIRAWGYTDVEIADCDFISDRANSVSEGAYMIELSYSTGGAVVSNGVYLCTDWTRGGCNNYRIHNNKFLIGEESGMAGVIKNLKGRWDGYDVNTAIDIKVADFYKDEPRSFTGYQMMTNTVADIYVYDNEIAISSKAVKYLYDFVNVRGLYIKNNNLTQIKKFAAGKLDGEYIIGAKLSGCISAEKRAKNFTVIARSENKTAPIVLMNGEKRTEMFCTASGMTTVAQLYVNSLEGGTVEKWTTEDGALYIQAVADDGYVFDGYYINEKRIDVNRYDFDESVVLELKFTKIN